MKQLSKEWFDARKGKITGSAVGAILGLNPWKGPEQVLRDMVRDYHGAERDFISNMATEYGNMHEPLATMEYMGKTGNHPEECGFYPHPEHDWLGASPDGLIDDDGLLEIKCPFGLRNKKGAELVFKTAEDQPHYYAQMQIEMFCTGRKWCNFYQWAPGGDSLERVEFSQQWIDEILPKLNSFYGEYLSELDNPEHLEDKAKEINTLRAAKLIEDYDRAKAAIDDAEARKKEILAELVQISKERDAVIHGRKLTKVERKGSVQYAKIPELKGVDLEPYRAKPSEFWRLS